MGQIAGRLMPQEDPSSYLTASVRNKIYFGKRWQGPPATPLFAHTLKPQRLQAWIPSFQSLICEHLSQLDDTGGGQIDLFQWCNDQISAVTVRALLGELAENKQLADQWVALLRESEPDAAFMAGPYQSLKSCIDLALHGERQIYARIRTIIYPAIDEEIDNCISGKPERDDASFLSGMVRAWYNIRLDRSPSDLKLARRRIANDLFFFTLAAITNSFAGAAWTIYHVLRNSNGCGDRIRPELERFSASRDANGSTATDAASIDDLPELEKTLYEIGRIYTPGSLLRLVVNEPLTFPSTEKTLTIQPGSMLSVNVALIHRNPDIYRNPLDFDPRRYDEGRDERILAGCNFIPFGAGLHPCTGRKFAILETAIFVSEAFRQFDFLLPDADSARSEDPFTRSMVNYPRHHPPLNPWQTNSIWRPVAPVWVKYRSCEVKN